MIIKKIEMKDKRGIVLPETLKIIIGVLCILLLIYLAVKLYDIFRRSSELEQARATVDAIVGKAEAMSDGETLDYLVIGPKNWRMLAYKDKFCICPIASGESEQQKICETQGYCKSASAYSGAICDSGKIGEKYLASCLDMLAPDSSKAGIIKKYLTYEDYSLGVQLPFRLYITKLYNTFYFGNLPYNSGQILAEGYYSDSSEVIGDAKFQTLLKIYLENPNEENKKFLRNYINGFKIIQDAFSKGYFWSLDFNPYQKEIYSLESINPLGYNFDKKERLNEIQIETSKGRISIGLYLGKWYLLINSPSAQVASAANRRLYSLDFSNLFADIEFQNLLKKMIEAPDNLDFKNQIITKINEFSETKNYVISRDFGWALIMEEGDTSSEDQFISPFILNNPELPRSFAFSIIYNSPKNGNAGLGLSEDLILYNNFVLDLNGKKYTPVLHILMDNSPE